MKIGELIIGKGNTGEMIFYLIMLDLKKHSLYVFRRRRSVYFRLNHRLWERLDIELRNRIITGLKNENWRYFM